MTRPVRLLALLAALTLGPLLSPALAQDEPVDPNAAPAACGGEGSPFMGYMAGGFFVAASIFVICKTARRS